MRLYPQEAPSMGENMQKEPTATSEVQETQEGTQEDQKWWQKHGTSAAWVAVVVAVGGIVMQCLVLFRVTFPAEDRARVAATRAAEVATRQAEAAVREAEAATREAVRFQPEIKVYEYLAASPDLLASADLQRLRGLLPPRVIPTTYQRQMASQRIVSPDMNYSYLFLLFVNRGQGPLGGLTINKLQWERHHHFSVYDIPKLDHLDRREAFALLVDITMTTATTVELIDPVTCVEFTYTDLVGNSYQGSAGCVEEIPVYMFLGEGLDERRE